MNKESISKLIKFIAAVAIGIVIMVVPQPTDTLTAEGLKFMGIFVSMIFIMIFGILPDAITVLLALAAMLACGVAGFSTIFSGFSSSTVWMVVALVGFATGIINSGLMKRIAFSFMKLFKPTYQGQILAIMVTGGILSPCIPNLPAKVSILAPFAAQTAEALGIEKKSKGAAGLFSAMFYPANIFGLCFMTGATMVYLLQGMMSDIHFTWLVWCGATIVWGIICMVGYYFFNTKYYKVQADELPADFVQKKLDEMGPISSNEKFAAVLLIVGIIAWMTTSIHGVDSFVIAMILWVLMVAKGLFTPAEITTKLPWTVIIMMGAITGIASLFSVTGLGGWLQATIAPLISTLVPNAFMLIIVVSVVTYILRYAVVSLMACLTIMFAIFAPIAATIGVSPFVVIWTAYTATQVWNLSFHNTSYIMAEGMSGGLVEWKNVAASSYFYMIINLLGNLACIPVWKLMGFIG